MTNLRDNEARAVLEQLARDFARGHRVGEQMFGRPLDAPLTEDDVIKVGMIAIMGGIVLHRYSPDLALRLRHYAVAGEPLLAEVLDHADEALAHKLPALFEQVRREQRPAVPVEE